MILRELFVTLGLNINEAEFAKGELAAEAVKESLEKLVEWGKEVVEMFVEMAKGAVETAEDLEVTSQQIGLTTEALQELRYAGTFVGLTAESMTHSIMLLSRTMYEAKNGGEAQAKAFEKLGIKLTDAHGKLRGADDVIGDIADKISKLPDGTEKTALAMHFFGRSGAQMVPLLNKGKQGIAELREEAQELGLVLDEETIKKGVEVEHTWKRISAVWSAIKTKAGAALLPELEKMSKSFERWLKANKDWIKLGIESVMKGFIYAGKGVAETVSLLARNIDLILVSLGGLAVAFLATKTAAIVSAAATIEAWMAAAAPFLLIGSAIAGFLLLFDDIRMYAKYGDKAKTLTGDFVKMLKEFEHGEAGDSWLLRQVREIIHNLRVAIEYIHEINEAFSGEAKPANANNVTSASPAFKRLASVGPKTQMQIAREQNEAVGGRLDAERNAGFFEGIYWKLTRPDFDFSSKARSGQVVNHQQNFIEVHAAPGQSHEDIGQMVVDKIQKHWDTQMEDAQAGNP